MSPATEEDVLCKVPEPTKQEGICQILPIPFSKIVSEERDSVFHFFCLSSQMKVSLRNIHKYLQKKSNPNEYTNILLKSIFAIFCYTIPLL